jgi:hypothetical protein
MTEESSPSDTLFARLLCDVMIPAEVAMAIRTQGYDVAEARTLPAEIALAQVKGGLRRLTPAL